MAPKSLVRERHLYYWTVIGPAGRMGRAAFGCYRLPHIPPRLHQDGMSKSEVDKHLTWQTYRAR
jgi:hypothetical protein